MSPLKVVPVIFPYLSNRKSLKNCETSFISSKKLLSFSRYSNICITSFHSFSPCLPLQHQMIERKFYGKTMPKICTRH